MSMEAIIFIGCGLAFGLGGAIYARWSPARLERQDRGHPAE